MIDGIVNGLSVAVEPFNLLMVLVGCFVGTFIGMLPGLGPITAIAIMVPITYGFEPSSALILMAGVYYGAIFGGSTSSILLNDPGVAGTVATSYDGYPMARKGMAGKALAIAAYASFSGGTIATIGLMIVAPILAELVRYFQSPDYLLLMVLGLTAVAAANGRGQFLKAVMMVVLGLMLATVGFDPGSGTSRFTFGAPSLGDGISFLLLAMSLFALSEALMTVLRRQDTSAIARQAATNMGSLRVSFAEIKEMLPVIGRSSILGFVIGILPGAGAAIASFLAYGFERNRLPADRRHEFGEGSVRGLAAPETANNAACSGSFLPLLTLGIPGSGTTAIMLSALISYGVQPGPFLYIERADVFWSVIISMYFGNLILLALNLPLIPFMARLLTIPPRLVVPVLVLVSIAGVYLASTNPMDVFMILAIGLAAVFMRLFNYPMAPLFLAFVLGRPIESALQRSMQLADGSLSFLWERETTLAILVITVALVLFAALRGFKGMQSNLTAGEGG